MKNYQFIISLQNKITKPVKAMQGSLGKLGAKAAKVKGAFDRMPASIKQLETRLVSLRKARKDSFSTKGIKAYQKQIKVTERQLSKLQKKTSSGFGAMKKSLLGLPSLMAGAFAVGGIASFGSSVVKTLAQFEKMEAVLTNTLGSKSQAQAALQQIKDFAATTPFQVDELSESFVKLANQNMTPTLEQMRQMGDLASSVGKSYDQLTGAIIDASQSQFQRLKQFGIKAKKLSKEGVIEFTFRGEPAVKIDDTRDAIRDYILSLGDLDSVQGSMAAISETTGGKLSNLADRFTNLKLTIGQELQPVISQLIDWTSKLVGKMGVLVKWISANRDSILRITKAMAGLILRFLVLTKGLKVIVGTLNLLRSGFMKLFTLFKGFVRILSVVRNAMMAFNAVLLANPIGVIIVGILALGAAIAAIVTYWDELKAAIWLVIEPLVNLVDTIFPGFKEGLSKFAGWFKDAFLYIYSFIAPVVDAMKWLSTSVGGSVDAAREAITKKAIEQGLIKPMTQDDFDRWKEFAGSLSAIAKKRKALTGALTGGGLSLGLKKKEADATGLGGTKKPSQVNKGLSSVVGDPRQVKNINININKLVEKLLVTTNTFKESPQKIQEEVTKALMKSVNDVNYGT